MKPVLLLMTFLYALGLKAQTGGNDTLSIDDKAYKFLAKKTDCSFCFDFIRSIEFDV